jgi:hypothetical protein
MLDPAGINPDKEFSLRVDAKHSVRVAAEAAQPLFIGRGDFDTAFIRFCASRACHFVNEEPKPPFFLACD